jgi:hypothetical protein
MRQPAEANLQRASPVDAARRARHSVTEEAGRQGIVVELERDSMDFVPACQQPGREPGGPALPATPAGREPVEDQRHPQ